MKTDPYKDEGPMRPIRLSWRNKAHLANARGASLVEILAAVVIVVVTAAASGAFFTSQTNIIRTLTKGSACKAAVESQISQFTKASNVALAMQWKFDTATTNLVADTYGVTPPSVPGGIPYADPWLDDSLRLQLSAPLSIPIQAAPILSGPIGASILDTIHLQRGSMALLTSLYNGVPGICTGVPYSAILEKLGTGVVTDLNLLKNFASTIQIEAFDLKTGATLPCTPHFPRPMPVMVDDTGTFTGSHPYPATAFGSAIAGTPTKIVSFNPLTDPNVGFRVKIAGQYDEFSGATKTCGVAQEFRYPIDSFKQKPSVILNATGRHMGDGSVDPPEADAPLLPTGATARTCLHNPGDYAQLKLEIGFKNDPSGVVPATPLDPGTIFMCRDVSVQMNVDGTTPYCPGFPGGTTAGATMNGSPSAPPDSPWVPCDKVTVCQISPDPAQTLFTQPNKFEAYFKNVYRTQGGPNDGLWGCDVRIDVATVDMAGNFTLLSEKAHPLVPTVSQATALKYYQPSDCYLCYKKKRRSLVGGLLLGALIGIAFMLGPLAIPLTLTAVGTAGVIGATGACAVGACSTPKGYTHKYNSCTNSPPSRGFCRKVQPSKPAWWTASIATCPSISYAGPSGAIVIPVGQDGDLYENSFVDGSTAGWCEIEAMCTGGVWQGLPSDGEPTSPIFRCGQLATKYNLTTATGPAGAIPECYVPIEPPYPALYPRSNYSAYTICFPPLGFPTGPVYCQEPPVIDDPPYTDPSTGMVIDPPPYQDWNMAHYPPDPLNPTSDVRADAYTAYEVVAPMAPGLANCNSAADTVDDP
jgi:hypothetical protein